MDLARMETLLKEALDAGLAGGEGRNLIGLKARDEGPGAAVVAFYRVAPDAADREGLGRIGARLAQALAPDARVDLRWEMGEPIQEGRTWVWVPNRAWLEAVTPESEALLRTLGDRAAPVRERFAAALELGRHPSARTEAALFALACDPGESPLVLEGAGESLGIVWRLRKTEWQNRVGRLAPFARKSAEPILRGQPGE
jgi:hypothetical protein